MTQSQSFGLGTRGSWVSCEVKEVRGPGLWRRTCLLGLWISERSGRMKEQKRRELRLGVLGGTNDVKASLMSGDFVFLVLDFGLHQNCPHFYLFQTSLHLVQQLTHHSTCGCAGFKETLSACCLKRELLKPSQQQASPTRHPTQLGISLYWRV